MTDSFKPVSAGERFAGRVQTRSALGDLTALQADLEGRLVLPGAPGYEEARKPSDPRHRDLRPAAVAYCRSTADVAAVVGHAARLGLRVTPRSGGHCFVGRSSAGDLVVDVSAMDRISVGGGRVAVESGVRLGRLYPALAAHGLALPAGCGPTVGIAGLTLGGGLGLLGRRYGLTCDRLSAAEVVLADGRVVRCDDQEHPDLFWALRGAGGGHFGIVIRFHFDPVPEPTVTVFRLAWAPDAAAPLTAGWMDWAPAADDRLTAQLELSAPADPGRPPTARLIGTMIADRATTTAAVAGIRDRLGRHPVEATFTELPYARAKAVLGEDPPDSERLLESHRSQLFDEPFPAATVAQLVAQLGQARRPGQSRTLSFLPLGGAYNRIPAEATAFAHRRSRFLVEHIAAVSPTAAVAEQEAAAAWTAQSRRVLDPESSGGVYPNFPDADLPDWAAAYWGSNRTRLQQVKQRYDPDNLFWARQGLHPDNGRSRARV
jgi:FAD/FMN-containing dehydrogenase